MSDDLFKFFSDALNGEADDSSPFKKVDFESMAKTMSLSEMHRILQTKRRPGTRHAKTRAIIEIARQILAEHHPMTVRQVYYQLVSRQVINNNRSEYQGVSKALVSARQDGLIPWDWMEDRTRQPRTVSMWNDLKNFAKDVKSSYRRDVWANQKNYLEVWVEKDALSGLFLDVLYPYGVTLNVGRGYDGWDSIHNAASRFMGKEKTTILYYGDFDPSGDDMVRSLQERLAFFHCHPRIEKIALTMDDIQKYNLPPDPTKITDTRRAGFVAKYGDLCVELDALPFDVLQTSIKNEVEKRMDMPALKETLELEKKDKEILSNWGDENE